MLNFEMISKILKLFLTACFVNANYIDHDAKFNCESLHTQEYNISGYPEANTPLVGLCPHNFINQNDKSLCEESLGDDNFPRDEIIGLPVTDICGRHFKNIYCGVCNDAIGLTFWVHVLRCSRVSGKNFKKIESADCFILMTQPRSSIQYIQHSSNTGILPSTDFSKIAYRLTSLTFLLNFGFNGEANIMMATSNTDSSRHGCSKNEIYDPVNKACRKFHCAKGFHKENSGCAKTLVSLNSPDVYCNEDLICTDDETLDNLVQKNNRQPSKISINMTIHISNKLSDVIESNIMEKVHFMKILHIEMMLLIGNFNITISRMKLVKVDDSSFQCSGDEISNVTRYFVKFHITDRVNIFTSSEVKEIVFFFDQLKHECKFVDLKSFSTLYFSSLNSLNLEMVSQFTLWCTQGDKASYTYPDFVIDTGPEGLETINDVKVFINETGIWYEKGEYDLTLFYSEQELIKGNAIVCEKHARIMESTCPRIQIKEGHYDIFGNRSLLYGDHFYSPNQYEFNKSDLFLCPKSNAMKEVCTKGYNAVMEYQSIITLILCTISIVCLLLTILVYLIIPNMRNLNRYNMLSVSISMFFSHSIFMLTSISNIGDIGCTIIAILLHFLYLSNFFWMSVIAYDLYNTFGRQAIPVSVGKLKTFVFYNLYGWGIPFVIVSLSVLLHFTEFLPHFDMAYGALQINHNGRMLSLSKKDLICWINNPFASLFAFGLPSLFVWLSNIFLFALTIHHLKRSLNNKSLNVLDESQPRHRSACKHKYRGKSPCPYCTSIIYMRISSLMGFTWIFGYMFVLLTTLLPETEVVCYLLYIMSFLFTIFNALQGAFVFIAFVCNDKTIERMKSFKK